MNEEQKAMFDVLDLAVLPKVSQYEAAGDAVGFITAKVKFQSKERRKRGKSPDFLFFYKCKRSEFEGG